VTNYVKLSARVKNLAFISEEAAAWQAVRSLLIARSLDVDFQELYLGMLELRAREAYLSRGVTDHLWPSPGAHPYLLERHARHAQSNSEKVVNTLPTEITRLGSVIEKMMGGASKTNALKDTQEQIQRLYFAGRNAGLNTKKFELPSGVSTLKALWAKYAEVLPYVYAEHLQAQCHARGFEGLDYVQLATIPYQFTTLLEPSSRTKKTALPLLQVIEFK
jgi:hypothetical protein